MDAAEFVEIKIVSISKKTAAFKNLKAAVFYPEVSAFRLSSEKKLDIGSILNKI